MRYLFILISGLLIQKVTAQSFVNGDFENNKAPYDQINLSNDALNNMLPGVTSFGSYGDVDIINSGTYGGGGPQSKSWYIALTGGGTDIVALELKNPLVAGKKYSIAFYDRKSGSYVATALQLGLSETNNQFGTVVYNCDKDPEMNVWTRRVATFIAPNNGKYITVQMPSGSIGTWVNIDNFSFTDVKCDETLKIMASTYSIEKGSSITFTATGGNNYTWVGDNTVSSFNTTIFTESPQKTGIYTVTSHQEGCPDLSTKIAITVTEKIKDSVSIAKVDTVVPVKKEFVKFTKRKCKGRKYEVQQSMNVDGDEVKIHVYDKNKIDGDIVTIYLNGELIVENLTVSKEKKEITLHLQSGSNILVMYAINLGNIPPNTAAIAVNNLGKKYKVTTLVSDFKISGALELIYAPEGWSMK